MDNIWEFLYQTVTVSLVAALLLLVKLLLRDKLPPRWQYGVWVILALRALIPARTARSIAPPLAVWAETAKSAAELRLDSAYSGAFDIISIRHVLPWADCAPVSITDWLFAVYIAGAALSLLWMAAQYFRLRLMLRRGSPAGAETQEAIKAVAGKYGLKACRAVAVPGLRSAFVCGVIRPVLAVPEGKTPDEKVLLHELLHLKYRDALQNVFWCLLRALHWCNPFMQYVFNRIGNDMESLCDQRVLERLEGEERREYGSILLDMADAAYARAPGTSSISNGSKNIARRIEAIARFKRYPQGMTLVGVCAVIVLGTALLTGARADYGSVDYAGTAAGRGALRLLAVSRVSRCDTVAGAVDVYAQGLETGNLLYLAMSAPLEEQEYYYGLAAQGADAVDPDIKEKLSEMYRREKPVVYNLRLAGEERYLATLDLGGSRVDEKTSVISSRHVMIPIEIRYDSGWVVEKAGEAEVIDKSDVFHNDSFREYVSYGGAECAGGVIELGFVTEYSLENYAQGAPDPGNSFGMCMCYQDLRFRRENWIWNGEAAEQVDVQYQTLDEYDAGFDFNALTGSYQSGVFYSSSDGSGQVGAYVDDAAQGGYVSGFNGGGQSLDVFPPYTPGGAAVCIYADGELMGTALIKTEAAG